MVLAAVDARRAGVHRPLPANVLLQLHEPYLQAFGGQRLRPESAEAALAWATTPLYATSSLLIPAADGYLAFDYLIDAIDKNRPPHQALDVLIGFATPDEALDIGDLAREWSYIDQADKAFRTAESGGLFKGTSRRSWLIRREQSMAAAVRFADQALRQAVDTLGPDHPRTLQASILAACEIGNSGDRASAIQLLDSLSDRAERVLGASHRQTFKARDAAAQYNGDADPAAAARQCQELADDCSRALGNADELTIGCRASAAYFTHASGDPATAAHLFSALLSDMLERFHSPPRDILWMRIEFANCLAECGELAAADREWQQVNNDAEKTYGRLQDDALLIRSEHAWFIGKSGDPATAVALLERLLADSRELQNPDLHIMVIIQRSLAWWVGVAGNSAEALRLLTALLSAGVTRRENDRDVRLLRHMVDYWRAMNGPPEDIARCLTSKIASMRADLGPTHPVFHAVRRELSVRQTPESG